MQENGLEGCTTTKGSLLMRQTGDRRCYSPREILERRGLPEARFMGLWAGHGMQRRCDSCEQIIGPNEIEYELDFSQEVHAVTLRLHPRCWDDWSLEEKNAAPL
jgi:hypothetical protein